MNEALFKPDDWFLAMGASEFISGPISEFKSVNQSMLLEFRAFNSEREIKYVRGSLSEAFQERDSRDIAFAKTKTVIQYLDIDTNKSDETSGCVRAIGGGLYCLPRPTPDRIELEHYYEENEMGFYYPFDFRIVGFLSKGGEAE